MTRRSAHGTRFLNFNTILEWWNYFVSSPKDGETSYGCRRLGNYQDFHLRIPIVCVEPHSCVAQRFGARPSHRCPAQPPASHVHTSFSYWPWVLPLQHHFQSPDPILPCQAKIPPNQSSPSAFPNGGLIKFKLSTWLLSPQEVADGNGGITRM